MVYVCIFELYKIRRKDGTAKRTREIGGKSDKKEEHVGLKNLVIGKGNGNFGKKLGMEKHSSSSQFKPLILKVLYGEPRHGSQASFIKKFYLSLLFIKLMYVTDRRTDGQILK